MKKRIYTVRNHEDGEFDNSWSVFVSYPGSLLDTYLGIITKDPTGADNYAVIDGLVTKHVHSFQKALGYFQRCY